MIDLARVIKVHWETNSVDIVMSSDGRAISGVRVMASSASTNSGVHDLPMPETNDPNRMKSTETTRDIIAVVAYFNDLPVVMGFLHPRDTQMLFADKERMIYRHASDVYQTIDADGNMELAHPSGAYVRFGTSPAHENLTGKDYNKQWKITKNTGKKIHIHIEQAGGVASVDITPDGAVTINTASTVTITASGAVTVNAPSVTLNTPTTHCTGVLNVDGLITGAGGLALSGGSGAAAQITGALATSGDVTAGSISLQGHHHSDAQGGNTGAAQ